ncbi:L-aspartate oxidase [Paenibacillus albiflavus]|uniref:L-aspartate oxidase n=1 Tax=Paenibacillus albiflavus TaxID=2545760 RepID=A0A4R4E5N6_9BACL|nr:L-aspartate oxidase [Paenibacillus albiflavus]TCZ74337.1 L-aspartate oxidase [Paenibacillus albiflavus]
MIPRYLVDVDFDSLPKVDADVIVIGSGIAGLFTALKASESHQVLLITKKSLLDSNTQHAQGGIAAVISDEDSPEYHSQDTLMAGAGLCSHDAVDVLVHEGPSGVRELIQFGTEFDLENGELALTREGAHSQRRILHAHGDATGAEIVRALSEKVRSHPNIELWDDHFVIDLLTADNGECIGALVQKQDNSRVLVYGNATVLCTGGAGQLYRYTTNPDVATGDGIGLAYRAGAIIQDMEFIQFHPTSLCYPGAPRFLISEAVRGEGAYLRNIRGERFMERYHELLELAPRDIVARAIVSEMEETRSTYVYIDVTHESEEMVKHRFPTIYEYCMKFGLDLSSDWIPVAPAAHYMMGGIQTDLHGETNVKRLFACGEVSSTGVHGANRLASNSLSEAIVFGRRIIERIHSLKRLTEHEKKIAIRPEDQLNRTELPIQPTVERKLKLQKVMLRQVGLKRSAQTLQKGLEELSRQLAIFNNQLTRREEYEFTNLLICALLSAEAALRREESRGGHYREDFPNREDQVWLKHIQFLREQGILEESIVNAQP